MSEGKRPGGLTALAVINFVFTGFGALNLLALAALLAFISLADTSDADIPEGLREAVEMWKEIGVGFFYVALLLELVNTTLLLLSGIGYLKQKKFLGRGLGSLYGVLGIVGVAATTLMVQNDAVGGFQLLTLLAVIYPLLTLILLNTTFKHDFIR